MNKYLIKCVWTMTGEKIVSANSLGEALEIAETSSMPEGTILADSFGIEGWEELTKKEYSYEDNLCENGHLWRSGYEEDLPCPECGKVCVWFNVVEEKEQRGHIPMIEWKLLEIEAGEKASCGCCDLYPARYRMPSEEEHLAMRHVWDEECQDWVPEITCERD